MKVWFNTQPVLNANGRFVIIKPPQKGTVKSLIDGISVFGVIISEEAAKSEAGVSSAGIPDDSPAPPTKWQGY